MQVLSTLLHSQPTTRWWQFSIVPVHKAQVMTARPQPPHGWLTCMAEVWKICSTLIERIRKVEFAEFAGFAVVCNGFHLTGAREHDWSGPKLNSYAWEYPVLWPGVKYGDIDLLGHAMHQAAADSFALVLGQSGTPYCLLPPKLCIGINRDHLSTPAICQGLAMEAAILLALRKRLNWQGLLFGAWLNGKTAREARQQKSNIS